MTAAPPDVALPRRFGPYLLFDHVGDGGMARLFLAVERLALGGDRLVVLKQVLPLLGDSAQMAALLVDEAKLSARLVHSNIAQVLDLGRLEDTLFIAMEYVEGVDLRELLRACSKHGVPLPAELALLIVSEALRGLDYAHRYQDDLGQPRPIIHRDVSPSNVLVSLAGEVKVCDFGIARLGGAQEAPEEKVQGKASYMSPEAARGEPLDGRSDLFAVGVILWELLAGRRMPRGERPKGPPTIAEVASGAPAPPLVERGLPHEEVLRAIVAKALAPVADERFQRARDFAKALDDYAQSAGLLASPVRFGHWLSSWLGPELIARRRERERRARAALGTAAGTAG